MNKWIKFFKNSPLITNHKPSHIEKQNTVCEILLQDGEYNLFLEFSPEINVMELENLCNEVGWVKRPAPKVHKAIQNSFMNVALYIEYNRSKKLIGFVRALSDHTFNATIWDMVIHPKYQKQGLGTLMMKRVIKKLRYLGIDTITLFTHSQNFNFYSKLGFKVDAHQTQGMFWYPQ
uniref:GCN5-like N-acetyltransferase n=1 Tax=Chroothece richteriana TaxID=101928 RepID=UPI001FCCF1DA|nr:GCN5-like N-acetyltransferase [Chroothece richteriana]UNJ14128.1 GCN5-like N-acetyltransferase [Chroothece richteriana]